MTTPTSTVPVPRPRRHRDWRQALIGWAFALPFVVLFTVFMAGPILASLITSFTDMRVTDIRKQAKRLRGDAKQKMQDQAHELEAQQHELKKRLDELSGDAQKLLEKARVKAHA